jgi:hypothetical protein
MKSLLVLALSLLMLGCSSGESDSRDETIGKEIADDYNRALDKAENVEALMQEQKEKMDEALKNAQDP